jgi:isoleucyl-tRNA synthetase
LQVAVNNADGEKCERCWRWEPSVGSHDDHATLCTRCVEAVNQATA